MSDLVASAIDLERAILRSNANYELVLFDRLAPAEQALLADLTKQPDFYGVLRPVGAATLNLKSVTRETALLYLTMKEAGTLPAYARSVAPADLGAAIARLVLDQILEIQHGDRFVSGAEAYDLLYGSSPSRASTHPLQRLSISALQYGQALALTDSLPLSLRLYHFHRLPVTRRWRRVFCDAKAVAKYLGVDDGGRYAEFVKRHWHEVADVDRAQQPTGSDTVGWLSWSARRSTSEPFEASASNEKLYVSPMPEFLENVFAIALRTLSDTRALQLKIGADAEGLLRPDKIVAYFANLDDLRRAADALTPRLHGCPAHGVPFTAPLDDDGLLSRGVDPPATQHLLNWQPRESWRLWLTNRLAHALLTAKRAASTLSPQREPWQYALERVRLEGVDTDTWTPHEGLWR
jgi:hypothetical protein